MEGIFLSPLSPDQLSAMMRDAVRAEITEAFRASKPEPQTEFITRKTTAALLGVSLPTLHEWTLTGRLMGYRIGTRVRYKRAEVETALQAIKGVRK